MEVPEHIDADVSEMHIGETLRLEAIPKPAGVKLLDAPETVIATVTQPTRVEEPEPEEEEVEGEVPEGEAAEEGAAAEGEAEAGTGEQGEPGTAED